MEAPCPGLRFQRPSHLYQGHPCGSCSISPLTLAPPCRPRKGESSQRPWAQCCEHRLWFSCKAAPCCENPDGLSITQGKSSAHTVSSRCPGRSPESCIHPSLPLEDNHLSHLPPLLPFHLPSSSAWLPQSCSLNCAPQDPKAHHCLSPVFSHLQLTHLQPRPSPGVPFSTEHSLVSPLLKTSPICHQIGHRSQGGHHRIRYE